jgi:ribosomal protein S18 acetylase RimI-like enzyme
MTPPVLRGAVEADTDAVVELLAQAFLHDPVSNWVVPDHDQLLEINRRVFRVVVDAALAAGHVDVDGQVTAAAVWFDVPAATTAAGDQGPEPDAFTEAIAQACGEYADRALMLSEVLAPTHPDDVAHRYLPYVGVAPESQGTGLGTALLRSRLDSDGTPAYLEASSSRNRSLYLRLGFTDLGPPVTLPGGPPLWPMWYKPSP